MSACGILSNLQVKEMALGTVMIKHLWNITFLLSQSSGEILGLMLDITILMFTVFIQKLWVQHAGRDQGCGHDY